MKSAYVLMFVFMATSCKQKLNKGTIATNEVDFVISIVDEMGPRNFYNQLHDSLKSHCTKIGGTNIDKLGLKENTDVALSWLQDQFDNQSTGLELKAASPSVLDRTSGETSVWKDHESSDDVISFLVNVRTDSIPKEILHPIFWKRQLLEKNCFESIQSEKEKFRLGGTLIRTSNAHCDTLYGYGYQLNFDITLNYFKKEKKEAVTSNFSIPARVVVYHQLNYDCKKS